MTSQLRHLEAGSVTVFFQSRFPGMSVRVHLVTVCYYNLR